MESYAVSTYLLLHLARLQLLFDIDRIQFAELRPFLSFQFFDLGTTRDKLELAG